MLLAAFRNSVLCFQPESNVKLHVIDANDQGVVSLATKRDETTASGLRNPKGAMKKYNLGTGKCSASYALPTRVKTFFKRECDIANKRGLLLSSSLYGFAHCFFARENLLWTACCCIYDLWLNVTDFSCYFRVYYFIGC